MDCSNIKDVVDLQFSIVKCTWTVHQVCVDCSNIKDVVDLQLVLNCQVYVDCTSSVRGLQGHCGSSGTGYLVIACGSLTSSGTYVKIKFSIVKCTWMMRPDKILALYLS
ncbi:uncharacterized protein [Dysidea avara]|uniref:uncharacterized protein isoform X2 n=1 Tax=Dysidea avara TaxID=196820 RepID=UPI003317A82E